jgi:hypothetical protein
MRSVKRLGRLGPAMLVVVAVGLPGCSGEPGERGRADSAAPVEQPADAARAAVGSTADAAREAADRFNADRAWDYLVRQVEFGPRVPGTPAHQACGDWIEETLRNLGGRVSADRFDYTDPDGRTWPLRNILARFGPEGDNRLLLLAHWDCRPWADEEPDSLDRMEPVLGANDAASGVAVLLEIAHHLPGADLPVGVDLLFTDGEDLGRAGDPEGFCRGSKRFAAKGVGEYGRAVLLDLVGDADLSIPVEPYSVANAPEVVDWVWGRAEALGVAEFRREFGPPVYDDHVPLQQAGLAAVDIIDFDYPAWHTRSDDLSKVDRRSLEAVGRVVLSLAVHP